MITKMVIIINSNNNNSNNNNNNNNNNTGLSFITNYRGQDLGIQVPVVRRSDDTIHWINLYPVDNAICFVVIYPLDSNLSVG